MELFSNREIATGTWILLGFIASLFSKNIRKSYSNLIKSFLNKYLILYTLFSIIYFTLIIYFLDLYLLKFQPSQLKDAIIWFVFSGLIATGSLITKKNSTILKDIILENIKLTIFVEYLITTYVFDLLIEISIFPILLFLIVLVEYSRNKPEYGKVHRLLNFIQIASSFYILLITIISAIIDIQNLFSLTTLVNILLPLLLMVLYIPLMYILSVYVKYENFFVRTKVIFGNIQKEEIGRYLRRKILQHCKLSYGKIKSIDENKFGYWQSIQTVEEADNFLSCVKKKKIYEPDF